MGTNLASEWVRAASGDLRTVYYLENDAELTHIVAFHAQQCVEKCLKAIIEFYGHRIPRDHSTIRLHAIASDLCVIEIEEDILIDLDELYIESRYPTDTGLLPNGAPTIKDCQVYIETAQRVYVTIEQIVNIVQ